MGSVPVDYKCPLCGRKGMGGSIPDGLDYAICTKGEYSCLWFQFQRERGPRVVRSLALQGVFVRRMPDAAALLIVESIWYDAYLEGLAGLDLKYIILGHNMPQVA